ncbi:MAG: SDR family oxidoreductase [Gammaproteobacteria bacterium]
MSSDDFTGRVALVTGGARRLGAAIVRELHGRGMQVVVHYGTSSAEAGALVAELEARRTGDASAVTADLSDAAAPAELAAFVRERFGRLDMLVNNASVFRSTPLAELTRLNWTRTQDVNLTACVFLVQALAPMLAEHSGSVVNVTDAYLVRPRAKYAAYVAAKAGLAALTQALALELAPDVRVNAVAPGALLWPEPEPPQTVKDKVLTRIPLGRLGAPADLARAVAYLASEPYLTGVTIPVDGGFSCG